MKASRSPCARELGEVEARLILQRRQRGVVEGRDEDVVDQILHRLAAAAMGERHRRHVDLCRACGRGCDGSDVHAGAPRDA